MGLYVDDLAADIQREVDDNNATRADYERALDIVFDSDSECGHNDTDLRDEDGFVTCLECGKTNFPGVGWADAADLAPKRDIYAIANEQGWDRQSIIEVMGGYIAESGNLDNLAAYADAVAKRENGE